MLNSIYKNSQSLERKILENKTSNLELKKLFNFIFKKLKNKSDIFFIDKTKDLYLGMLETLEWFSDIDELEKDYFLPIFNELKLGKRDFSHLSYGAKEFEYVFSDFFSNKKYENSILNSNKLFIKEYEKANSGRILDYHSVPVYIDEKRYFFKDPSKKLNEKFVKDWKNLNHIHEKYIKHHHNSKNSKASKFYSTINIKNLQQSVFENGIGILREQNGIYNQIWTYANFDSYIGKLPNGEKTTLARLQIDNRGNKYLELHAYPVGKKSIIDDVGNNFYERIMKLSISTEKIKRK